MHDRPTTAICHPGFSGLQLSVHSITFMPGDKDAALNPGRHIAANRLGVMQNKFEN
jgi:hypothetical protein